MHGHMPQQHHGMHPAHQQPPPHLAHLSSLPPHTMQRDHPANRLNNVRHHHPRGGVDHQAAVAAAMAAPPHLQMQVPPPPAPHQPQNARKPPPPSAGTGYYAPNGTIHGGLQKPPLPLTAAHMHPPPTLNVGPVGPQQQQQQSHPGTLPGQHPGVVVGGKLPYGMGQQQQQQQHPGKQSMSHQHHPSVAMAPPPIPVVSAATPAGTKTRHIPSNTDQKHHHHSHNTSQPAATAMATANGNLVGPGSKPTAEKQSKSASGAVKHHHASTKEMTGVTTTTNKVTAAPVATAAPPVTVSANPPNATVVSIIPGTGVNVVSDAASSGTATVATGAGATASATVATTTSGGGGTDDAMMMAQGSGGGGGQQQGGSGGPTTTLSSSNSSETLANMKEKTTMCLVNELARYNKIQHQYRLTGETGPAHSKRFTVTLKLGDEEYTSEGASIKKAQHKAAGDAIAATKYKHPPARTNRRTKSGVKGNVGSFTPTVELNALAMKRGEPTVYKVVAVPSTVSKYALGGGQPGTVPGGGSATGGGRRTMVGPATGIDKLPPTVPAGMLPPYGGSSLPPGAHGGGGGGRYGQPGHSIDGGGGAGGAPYWNRGPGVGGGRGGMGGFHPGNHPQQQQQQQQLHAHLPRGPAGLGIEEHHHHHHLHHHHPPPPPSHVNHHHHLHHHQHDATGGGHAAVGYGGAGGGAGAGVHHPSSAPLPAQELYKATLRVGERTFLGEGHTPQAARHDAAARALEVLKPLTASEAGSDGKGKPGGGGGGAGGATAGAGDGETAQNGESGEGGADGDPNAELKSPISLVHEMAVQRQLSVVFEVISEKGPPHMTVFVTQCKVGTIVTEGEGTGKKLSKKRAAEKMLEQLRNLRKAEQQAALSNGGSDAWTEGKATGGNEKRKAKSSAAAAAAAASAADGSAGGAGAGVATLKKKARNLIKEKSVAEGGVSEKENPISRLMQIQQARKEKQPVYALVEGDRPTTGRRKQFTIEVTAAGKRAVGVGMTKKAAKWTAAEALLIELGYAPSRATGGPVNKENQSSAANEAPPSATSRKVLFNDQADGSTAGTPLKPVNGSNQGAGATQNGRGDGARDLMNDSTASNDSMATNSSGVSSASSGGAGGQTQAVNSSVPSGSSATSTPSKPDVGRNKEQLLYLAQLLKFEVQFSDFPKGNHGQYLTLVVLTTEPPQMCHGSGASLQESQDEAARCALEMLAKIGLDNVKPKTVSSAPDGAIAAGGASK